VRRSRHAEPAPDEPPPRVRLDAHRRERRAEREVLCWFGRDICGRASAQRGVAPAFEAFKFQAALELARLLRQSRAALVRELRAEAVQRKGHWTVEVARCEELEDLEL
jgi:hypothetical protein